MRGVHQAIPGESSRAGHPKLTKQILYAMRQCKVVMSTAPTICHTEKSHCLLLPCANVDLQAAYTSCHLSVPCQHILAPVKNRSMVNESMFDMHLGRVLRRPKGIPGMFRKGISSVSD